MTDDDFLEAILADPDNDAPRLLYADYLEERGRLPRAEFNRVQCPLALLPEGDPGRAALEARKRRFLNRHDLQWAGDVPRWVDQFEFRRGFIEYVRWETDMFLGTARRASFAGRVPDVCEFDIDKFLYRLTSLLRLTPVRHLELRPRRKSWTVPSPASPLAPTPSDDSSSQDYSTGWHASIYGRTFLPRPNSTSFGNTLATASSSEE